MKTEDVSSYDVVIVGAGPAGCITSRFLDKDFKVLLLDWSRMPRDKPCGGLLVEEAYSIIKKLNPLEDIFSLPRTLNLKNVDWNNDIIIKTNRNLVNISRRAFDHWLLKLSEGKVKFSSETKFLDFKQRDGALNILVEKSNKKEIIRSKYLIGADGALSSIRRQVEKRQIKQYFAVQELIKSDKNVGDNALFIYDNKITDFYSWVIPKDKNMVIGSALEKNDIKSKFNFFKNKLKARHGVYGTATKKEVAIINRVLSKKDISLGKNNVFLVGESAGLISPSTGEGISFAVRSGLNCANAINKNFDNAFMSYMYLCQPLENEIEKKVKKAEMLSDPEKRLTFLKK